MKADWQQNLLHSRAELRVLLEQTRRIAVLGIKPESHSLQPAYYVPQYLQQVGFEIIPVPVYYQDVTHILGQSVCRDLRRLPPPVHLVNVFRRPQDLQSHLDALLELHPDAVWLQTGIREDNFAEHLARAGIRVVQDECLMVIHRSIFTQ